MRLLDGSIYFLDEISNLHGLANLIRDHEKTSLLDFLIRSMPRMTQRNLSLVAFSAGPMFLSRKAIRGLILPSGGSLSGGRFLGDGEAIDAEVGTDAVDDEQRPAEVYDHGEDEVCAEIPQFDFRAHGWQAKGG